MAFLALALALAFAPAPAARPMDAPAPAAAPPKDLAPDDAIPWNLAGARSWTLCEAREQEAARRLRSGITGDDDRRRLRELLTWVDQCPHAPAVLILTAELELVHLPAPEAHEDPLEVLPEVSEAIQAQRRRALRRLRDAATESERRGDPPPAPCAYLTAYAAIGLGDLATARVALADARARAEVEGWRLDRIAAFAALFGGDLREALRLAQRSVTYATGTGRYASLYALAIALDRAGSVAASRAIFAQIRTRESRDHAALDTLLPVHERLYLMAIEQEAKSHDSSAIRHWEAYLGRAEVEAPERTLAERRLAALHGGPSVASP